MEERKDFKSWAIVEIMGHQRLAGFVSERTIAGAPMLQVDVPDCPAGPYSPAVAAFTTFVGGASIYRLTPCTEEIARSAVRQFREQPITCVQFPSAPALPPPDDDEDPDLEDDRYGSLHRLAKKPRQLFPHLACQPFPGRRDRSALARRSRPGLCRRQLRRGPGRIQPGNSAKYSLAKIRQAHAAPTPIPKRQIRALASATPATLFG